MNNQNKNGESVPAMKKAIANSNVEIDLVRILCKNGANVNVECLGGKFRVSALMIAQYCYEICKKNKILLEHGARAKIDDALPEIEHRGDKGNSPLMNARGNTCRHDKIVVRKWCSSKPAGQC